MPDALRDLWTALLALPHLKLYLSLAWAVYLLWLGSWIMLQKREPVATLRRTGSKWSRPPSLVAVTTSPSAASEQPASL